MTSGLITEYNRFSKPKHCLFECVKHFVCCIYVQFFCKTTMPNFISVGNYNTSRLFFPLCVFLLCALNKLLDQSTQAKLSLFLISVSAETPRAPRTRRKRKSTNANSSAPSSGMNSTSGKKKSPSTSGFTLASQDVMVVGEPSLMGGEFGDEDERLITR